MHNDRRIILLVSNSLDFATDYVVGRLLEHGHPYYRIDTDLLHEDHVSLDPSSRRLKIERGTEQVSIGDENLKSVLYRAPTHLRESSGGRWPPEELLARHQWTAFVRSLCVFENAKWINHPAKTYLAENKPYQLMMAEKLGFIIPKTIIGNVLPGDESNIWHGSNQVAIKAIDSFLLRIDEEDRFFYTQAVRKEEIQDSDISEMPVIMQEYLTNKLDIRVTIIGDCCFACSIFENGKPIDGDWRLAKARAAFEQFDLPHEIKNRCIALVAALGLTFGAIDLVLCNDIYIFIEINPTGEWAWLVDALGLPIDEAIVQSLCN